MKRQSLALTVALAGAQLFLGPDAVRAQTFCSEPVLPFCVNRAGLYEDAAAADRCGQDIRGYAAGMRRHADCLEKQAKESVARAAEIEARHECMKASGDDCR